MTASYLLRAKRIYTNLNFEWVRLQYDVNQHRLILCALQFIVNPNNPGLCELRSLLPGLEEFRAVSAHGHRIKFFKNTYTNYSTIRHNTQN